MNQYQLKNGRLILRNVEFVDGGWYVAGIRNDNGLRDRFPIQYFKRHFIKMS